MIKNGPAAGLSRRWVLPLNVPDFTGEITSLKSMGETKSWLVTNSTVYLHPEYLAPPSQYEKHRAFEFGMVNPNFMSRKYRFAYGMGFPSGTYKHKFHSRGTKRQSGMTSLLVILFYFKMRFRNLGKKLKKDRET